MKSVFSTEKTYAQHGLHTIKSVLSTEKHMLNTDLIVDHTNKSVLSNEKQYAQHGLSKCEFIVTLAKSVLRKKTICSTRT